MGAFNKEIVHYLRSGISFDALGSSTPALLATASTLTDIALGGVDPWAEGKTSPRRQRNYRYDTADYYQDRLRIVHKGLLEIQNTLNAKGTHVKLFAGNGDGMPQGAYYLYPDFSFLRGQSIPAELQEACLGHQTFQNADDVTAALANAHLIGLQPMTVASGALFDSDRNVMTFRIATVDPDLKTMGAAVNTIKGLVQKTMGVDLGAQYAKNLSDLKRAHPVQEKSRSSWVEFIKDLLPKGLGLGM